MEYIQEKKIISITFADIARRSLTNFMNDTRKLMSTERWIKIRLSILQETIVTRLQDLLKHNQIIRISGMVVGGIIGGAIYRVERFFVLIY